MPHPPHLSGIRISSYPVLRSPSACGSHNFVLAYFEMWYACTTLLAHSMHVSSDTDSPARHRDTARSAGTYSPSWGSPEQRVNLNLQPYVLRHRQEHLVTDNAIIYRAKVGVVSSRIEGDFLLGQ